VRAPEEDSGPSSFQQLLSDLLASGREAGGRGPQHSVAQCVAVLCR